MRRSSAPRSATPKLSTPIAKNHVKRAIGNGRSRCLGTDSEILRRRYITETPDERITRANLPEAWVYVMIDPKRTCSVCSDVLKPGQSFRLIGTKRVIVCDDCIETSTMPELAMSAGPFDNAIRQSFEDTRLLVLERRAANMSVVCQ